MLLIHPAPRCIAKELKICVHKTNVHGCIIHTHQKAEMASASKSWWLAKQNMIYPCSLILYSNKNESLLTWMDESKDLMLNERKNKYILNDSVYMKLKNRKKETHHDTDQNLWGRINEWKQIRGNMLGFWKCSISWSEWLLHKVHLHENLFIYIS